LGIILAGFLDPADKIAVAEFGAEVAYVVPTK
jgi:hypothetical protein